MLPSAFAQDVRLTSFNQVENAPKRFWIGQAKHLHVHAALSPYVSGRALSLCMHAPQHTSVVHSNSCISLHSCQLHHPCSQSSVSPSSSSSARLGLTANHNQPAAAVPHFMPPSIRHTQQTGSPHGHTTLPATQQQGLLPAVWPWLLHPMPGWVGTHAVNASLQAACMRCVKAAVEGSCNQQDVSPTTLLLPLSQQQCGLESSHLREVLGDTQHPCEAVCREQHSSAWAQTSTHTAGWPMSCNARMCW